VKLNEGRQRKVKNVKETNESQSAGGRLKWPELRVKVGVK
jgi:hypothetical protein